MVKVERTVRQADKQSQEVAHYLSQHGINIDANPDVLPLFDQHRPGDINVNAPLSWSTANTLILIAGNAIAVNAPITVTGAGKVNLNFSTAANAADGSRPTRRPNP